ncbi:MAG: PQQ-binding-like beta-propeller repeat protein [Acidobacteriota bacterium]
MWRQPFFWPDRKLLVRALCLPLTLLAAACADGKSPFREWNVYLGDSGSSQYSELDQINHKNVRELRVAWVYHTGDKREDNRSQIQCNPIVVDGVLYATSAQLKVFALKAATGQMIWSFDPLEKKETTRVGVNRGVTYWEDGDDKRILFCAGHYLYALDAERGLPIPEFGEDGAVNLREGLDREIGNLFIGPTTPGAIYQDLLILGSTVSEGPGESAPGHVRAYDVRTGQIKWIFHTIPHPGEFGYETWPEDAWKRAGGANSWSGITVDEERAMVFIPTGSAAFDFWGGNRLGKNLFGNCILALKADTGERVWHFQTVRHDLWDRDLPASPNLVTVTHDGERIDAVAQITKSGHVFVLNRDTGEPLFPIQERPVPPSDLKGEQTWPTQPVPVKPPPFARQAFNEKDITDISPQAHAYIRKRFQGIRTGQQFIPPSTQGTMIFPGFDGGGEWGGAAYDPTTGMLYVNCNEMPWILTMVDVAAQQDQQPSPGKSLYAIHCAVCHGAELKGDEENPSLENIERKFARRADVRQIIEDGKGTMPGFGHLSEKETNALLDFLFRSDGQRMPSRAKPLPEIPYSHTGYNRFLDEEGYPAVKPPWGRLNAINLNTGDIQWQVRLGELLELSARGIPPTGTENYGGPVVTAGGLIFIGATKDEKFRAFDKRTGKVLWEAELPAGGYATPSTYEVNGRQYVVIAAGGGKMGTRSGDAYVAFALPD